MGRALADALKWPWTPGMSDIQRFAKAVIEQRNAARSRLQIHARNQAEAEERARKAEGA